MHVSLAGEYAVDSLLFSGDHEGLCYTSTEVKHVE